MSLILFVEILLVMLSHVDILLQAPLYHCRLKRFFFLTDALVSKVYFQTVVILRKVAE